MRRCGSLAVLATVCGHLSVPRTAFAGPADAATEAQALLEQARPCVEAVIGRVEPWPTVRMTDARDLTGADARALEREVRWQFPDLQGGAFQQALAASAELVRSTEVLRASSGGSIVLVPDNQARIAAWAPELAAASSPAFLQLALARLVIRGVLERRYDLIRREAACTDAEAFFALEAVIEGRAQWLTREVARRVGREDVFPLMADGLLRAPDVATDPALRAVSQQILRRRHWAMTHGLALWTVIEAANIKDVEAAVFRRPPTQTAWVDQPERYRRALMGDRPGLAQIVASLRDMPPPGDWVVSEEPWTPTMVRQAADLFGEAKRADSIVRYWEDGRLILWIAKAEPGRQIAVSVARFENASAARSFLAFVGDLERKQVTSGCVAGVRVIDARVRPAALADADESEWHESKMQIPPAPTPVASTRLRARWGVSVVEITWQGVPADAGWGEAVYRQLRAAMAP